MLSINYAKYINAILFLLNHTDTGVIQTQIMLPCLLYYADFDRFEYKDSMQSLTGDTYIKKAKTPLPRKLEPLIRYMIKDGQLICQNSSSTSTEQMGNYTLSSSRHPNMAVFNPDDKYILHRVVQHLGSLSGEELIHRISHEAPWLGVREEESIPYELSIYRGSFIQSVDHA